MEVTDNDGKDSVAAMEWMAVGSGVSPLGADPGAIKSRNDPHILS